jgi:hypothetical protein
MEIKTFEEYLRDNIWEPEGLLDDDMPDAFDAWLGELQVDDLIEYAETWGNSLIKKRIIDVEVVIAKSLPYDGECRVGLEELFNNKKL